LNGMKTRSSTTSSSSVHLRPIGRAERLESGFVRAFSAGKHRAAAPSLMPDELPAVTVPVLSKAGRNRCKPSSVAASRQRSTNLSLNKRPCSARQARDNIVQIGSGYSRSSKSSREYVGKLRLVSIVFKASRNSFRSAERASTGCGYSLSATCADRRQPVFFLAAFFAGWSSAALLIARA
jgi:hypothetical protein